MTEVVEKKITLNTRVTPADARKIKIYCLQNDTKVTTLLSAALVSHLTKAGLDLDLSQG